MALKEQLPAQEQEKESLTAEEEQDLSIAVNLAKNMIDDEGINVIKSAETSKDPGQVIGQFLFQMATALKEKLSGMIDLSPRIFLSEGGWVEQVSDYLQEDYGIPKDTMDRAEIYIGGTAQSVGTAALTQQGQAPQQEPVPSAQAQPILPQQGMM